MYTCIHVYMYTCIHVYTYVHICISISISICQEHAVGAAFGRADTVGFHNFNLRIFNLRVSNPNKLIVDVCLTR